jgi:hypothetical protein
MPEQTPILNPIVDDQAKLFAARVVDLLRDGEAPIVLEYAYGGDNCHNVDRVTRLPGTINIPDEKKRARGQTEALAEVVEFDPDRVYPIAKFNKFRAVEEAGGSPADAGPARKGASLSGAPGGGGGTESRAPAAEPIRDLEELDKWCPARKLGLLDHIKVIASQGHHPDKPKGKDNSRSVWLCDFCRNAIRCKIPDAVILGIIRDAADDESVELPRLMNSKRSGERSSRLQIQRLTK